MAEEEIEKPNTGSEIKDSANKYSSEGTSYEGKDNLHVREKPLSGKTAIYKKTILVTIILIVIFAIIPGTIIFKLKFDVLNPVKEGSKYIGDANNYNTKAWGEFNSGKTKFIEMDYSLATEHFSEANGLFLRSKEGYESALQEFQAVSISLEKQGIFARKKHKRLNMLSMNLTETGINIEDNMAKASENMVNAIEYLNKNEIDKENELIVEANSYINTSLELEAVYTEYQSEMNEVMG